MAAYQGFVCDSCGNVIPKDKRTEVITQYRGPVISGQSKADHCTECLGEVKQEDLKPLRKRRRTASIGSA